MRFAKPYPYDYRRPKNAKMTLGKKIKRVFKNLEEKSISPEETAIGFLDEVGAQNKANTVRVWSFNKSKVAKNTSHFVLNTIGFYAINGESVQDFIDRSNGQTIITFLEKVSKSNERFKAVIIILDNARSHIAKKVAEFAEKANIYLVFLPPYSPDLNPIEFIWKSTKRFFSVSFPHNLQDLKDKMRTIWSELSSSLSFASGWIQSYLVGKSYSMGFGG